jgi:type I restriction enzyme R subunit
MWLTGFDARSLQHTVRVDKPMRGHTYKRSPASIRVFHDKPSGRVVDYLGLAQELKLAFGAVAEGEGNKRQRSTGRRRLLLSGESKQAARRQAVA